MAMSRIALQQMEMDLHIGYYMWTAGILILLLPDIPSMFTIPSARWFATAALAVVIWVGTPTAISLTMHPASERDDFFYVVAWNFKEPSVCGKISPRAIGRDDQRGSSELTYMQSDCYRNLAAMLNTPQLCANVKSAGTDRLVGSVIAKIRCRNQRNTWGTALPQDGQSFVRTMKSLGYDDQYLGEWHYKRAPSGAIYEVHEKLLQDPLFVAALRNAPSLDESYSPEHLRPALPLEYVYELTAVHERDWKYCRRISPNATYLSWGHPGPLYSLRFACEFKTGLEIRDTSLCGELAQASKSRLVNRPFSAEQCMQGVRSLVAPEVHEREQPLTKYQEEVFPTREELQEALRELNYPGGLNWAQLFIPIDDQYWDFFWYLAPKDYQTMSYASMQEQASMRRDFLARVLAMK